MLMPANKHVSHKGKVVPVLLTQDHAMKAYWGNGVIAQHVLDLGTGWR